MYEEYLESQYNEEDLIEVSMGEEDYLVGPPYPPGVESEVCVEQCPDGWLVGIGPNYTMMCK
jgi:hypothetical protein